jgi:glyoxylase-like metal-dependent hydrolase (beta-lactamase superfamily II)
LFSHIGSLPQIFARHTHIDSGAIEVHHLNCGTMCPRGARLLTGAGGILEQVRLVAHCLLIEAPEGLVLLDTGFGTGDVADPGRLGKPFGALVRPKLEIGETAVRRVQRLGHDPADVRHILITHLDLDHAGGLADFPDADVHVFAAELAAARSPTRREAARYVKAQWAHGPKWVEHDVDGDTWLGFDSVRVLPGLDGDVAMVPLQGHTRGHTGIALSDDDGWLLHCGDAIFHHGELATPPSAPVGVRVYQTLTGVDNKRRRHNQERLRELAREHRDEVRLICSHDPDLLDGA